MADLIELDLVVREKGLKTSLTTVERLERQLTKAAKAIDNNRISQDRYNKVLLQAKRDYQALGMSSQKATATVRKFAEAQRGATQTTSGLTGALKQQTAAQMAATKSSNRMGVVTQQAGYQVSDFIVQVQSGTNAFVAFGQQASQLVGVLPLMAGKLGLTAGAAVGLSAGLGIAIPLVTAIGAALSRSSESAKDAAQDIVSFTDAIANLRSELELLQSGAESREVLQLNREIAAVENQIYDIKNRTLDLSYADAETKKLILGSVKDNNEATNEELKTLQAQLTELRMKKDAIRINKSLVNSEVQEQQNLLDNQRRENRERIEAQKKAKEAQEELLKLTLQVANVPVYEPMSATANAAQEANADMVEVFKTAQKLKEQLGEGAYEALRLAGVDMTSGIDAAARAAANLAADLNISLAAALEMQKIASAEEVVMSQPVVKGKVTDRYDVDTLMRMGYTKEYLILIGKIKEETKKHTEVIKDNRTAYEKAMMTAEEFADTLDKQVIGAVDSLSDAFSQFMQNGFKDFKGFVKSIGDMFLKLLADMAAAALKRKILIPIATGMSAGFGSQAAASTMAAGTGSFASGTIGASLAAGASSIGAGLYAGGATALGFSGAGISAAATAAGATAAGSAAMAIAAVAAPLLAVAAVFAFFKKKTKELDSGLRITAETLDATVESFKVIQTKRFFGLSKKVRTDVELLDEEAAGPIVEGIVGIQKSIMDAASDFGIASDVFDNFMYDMEISLKGLTEDQKVQKITEELNKMGDSFASLTGHFETMNELLEAANQRMQLQNRLDQLLGNNAAIIARQREAELAAMHELNRPLAQMIYNLEDAQFASAQANQAVAQATQGLRQAIDAEKGRIQASFANLISGLTKRLDVANEAMDKSRNIYEMLSGALRSRQVSGDDAFAGRRSSSLAFLRAGNFSDEEKLENALDVVAEPSEQLFGSFVDYARDFGRTSAIIDDAKSIARTQLDFDERQVLLLQQQIENAKDSEQAQLDALEKQFEALTNVNSSVLSVKDAIGALGAAMQAQAQAQAKAAAAAAAAQAQAAAAAGRGGGSAGGGGGAAQGVQQASAAGSKLLQELGQSGIAERASDGAKFQKVDIRGTQQLLDVAKNLGVQTSGQTGQQIQQAISNASNLGVSLDNSTRNKQFAMGGFHTGGLRMVGERGPELEATGPSRIFSHNQTKGMFKDPELVSEVRNLRSEVSGLRSEQRQMQASNAKYVKRNYDINRKWDTDGLPATRT